MYNGKIKNHLVMLAKLTNFGRNHGTTLQVEVFRQP
jgi:hypothetical protein